jgi:hypothetical protein
LITDLLILDNFFHDPDKEREFALSIPYLHTNFPNRTNQKNRTDALHLNYSTKFNFYKNLIYEKLKISDLNYFKTIGMSFQFNLEGDISEPHFDSGWDLAGVIYLTPNAPKSSGTAFYTTTNDHFEKVFEVENFYNRFIIYPATLYHEGQNFFGNQLKNSRLNLVFFANIS